MQSGEVDLGNVLVEGLALGLSNLHLKRSGLAGAIGTLDTDSQQDDSFLSGKMKIAKTYSKGTSTPGATTVDLTQVGQLTEGGLVAQGNVDQAMVSKSAHGSESSGLLATTLGTGRDKQTGVLAPVATSGPDTTGLVPESLPLGGEVTVAGGDTEEESIVFGEVFRVSQHGDGGGLGRGVHLGQDLVGEGLGDPIVKGADG